MFLCLHGVRVSQVEGRAIYVVGNLGFTGKMQNVNDLLQGQTSPTIISTCKRIAY